MEAANATRSVPISRRRWLLRGALASPAVALADAVGLEPSWIRTRKLTVGGGRLGIRFAHFTDVHFKGDPDAVDKVVRIVNASGVRFAVFTGDLIEETRHLDAALQSLGRLRVPLYGIPGNHDHWSRADFTPIRKTFAATGGRWMEDDHVLVADRIRLVGLDHPEIPVLPTEEAFRLVLIHYPAWADRLTLPAPGRRFDLLLAGHTHGGQVRLPFVGPLVTPYETGGYDLGWFETRAGPLYVNPGIGTFFADVRFLCRPEVTLFEV